MSAARKLEGVPESKHRRRALKRIATPAEFAARIKANTEALYSEKVLFAEFSATQRRLWDGAAAHGEAFVVAVTKALKVAQPTKEPTADAAMAFLRDLDPSHPGVRHQELESVLMMSDRKKAPSRGSPTITARVFCIHEARLLLQTMPANWRANEAQKTDRWQAGDRFIGFWFDGLLGSVSTAARWREPASNGELVYWDCGRKCPRRSGPNAYVKLKLVVLGNEIEKPFKFSPGMDWALIPLSRIGPLFKAGKLNAETEAEAIYFIALYDGSDVNGPVVRGLAEAARWSRMDRLRIKALKQLAPGVR